MNESIRTKAINEKREHAKNIIMKLPTIRFDDEEYNAPIKAEIKPKRPNHNKGKRIPEMEMTTISLIELFSILHIEADKRG